MHPNDGRVVSNFIIQALKNKDITIYGDGKQTRSFCFVDDLIDAILLFLGTDDNYTGPMNIGNPDEFTIEDLATKVIDLTNSKSKIIHKDLPEDDPKQRKPDISKAKEKNKLGTQDQFNKWPDANNTLFLKKFYNFYQSMDLVEKKYRKFRLKY